MDEFQGSFFPKKFERDFFSKIHPIPKKLIHFKRISFINLGGEFKMIFLANSPLCRSCTCFILNGISFVINRVGGH